MKKFLSLFLILTMLFTMLPFSAMAEESTDSISAGEPEMGIEGVNSVGNLLSNSIEAEMDGTEEESEDTVCSVSGIVVEGNVAIVTFTTDIDSLVIAAIYTEDGAQMLGSGQAEVTAGENTAEITINLETMPEFFVAGAYLVDGEYYMPLCEQYTSTYYTQAIQEVVDTTLEDAVEEYGEDMVLNLDDNPDTNFLVYSEDTIRVEENSQKNIITDNGDGTYTVTNADETFLNIKAGDSFSYEYEDGTVLVAVVKAVSVKGTTVTITEDPEATLDAIFSYIKIDEDTSDCTPEVTTEEGVTYNGLSEEVSEPDTDGEMADAETILIEDVAHCEEDGTEVDAEVSKSIGFSIDHQLNNSENKKISITGGITLNLNASIKFYHHFKQTYFDFKVEYSVAFEIGFSGSISGNLPFPVLYYFVGPAKIMVSLTPCFEVSGKIVAKGEYKGSEELLYDSDTGNKLQFNHNKPKPEMLVEISGEFFIGLEIEPAVALISEKLANCSLVFKVGGKITAKSNGSLFANEDASTSVKHDCKACIDGDCFLVFSASAQLSLIKNWVSLTKTFAEINIHLCDFYYSIDYKEGLLFATCPHCSYKVTVTVIDKYNNPLPNASILISGLDCCYLTDKDGVASFYLPDGGYTLSVEKDGLEANNSIKINGAPKTITMQLGKSYVTPRNSKTDEFEPGEDEVLVKSGCCGEDVYYNQYESGLLWIYGNGKMERNYGNYWRKSTLKDVVISSNVTSIGDRAFLGCDNLQSITMPNSVTSIGELAFYDCSSLTSITIPNSVTNIGDFAFEDCHSLTSVTIPSSVTSIGDSLFIGCNNLTAIEVHSQNPNYSSLDGVLYNKAKTILVTCPGGKSGSVAIPNSVTSISDSAFYDCQSLTNIIIPNSVTSIGNDAFSDCYSLTCIAIPNGVTSIGNCAFVRCNSLTNLTIPNSVTSIGKNAFSHCSSLTSVTIPSSVTSIGDYVFCGCYSLTNITMPSSVISIGDSAFSDCINLKDIYYSSDESDWNKITIDEYNSDLTSATIHYNSTGPSLLTQSVSEPAPDANECSSALEDSEIAVQEDSKIKQEQPTKIPEQENVNDEVAVDSETTVENTLEEEIIDDAFEDLVIGENVELAAAYSGLITTEGTSQIASFQSLVPGEVYLFVVTTEPKKYTFPANDTILFVSQGIADENGKLAFAYIPKSEESGAVAQVFGASNLSLSQAEITVKQDYIRGVCYRILASYNGSSLTEDYDYSVETVDNGDGTMSITLQGIFNYAGSQTVNFRWLADFDKDGDEDIMDMLRLIKYNLGLEDDIYFNADLNGDGHENLADVIRLLQRLTGKQVSICV